LQNIHTVLIENENMLSLTSGLSCSKCNIVYFDHCLFTLLIVNSENGAERREEKGRLKMSKASEKVLKGEVVTKP